MNLYLSKGTNWLKTNSKSIFLVLLTLVVLVVAKNILSNINTNSDDAAYNAIRNLYMDSVLYYKNRAGQMVAKTYTKTKYETSPADKKVIDSLRKQLSLSKKEISHYLRVIAASDYIDNSSGKADAMYYMPQNPTLPVYEYSHSGSNLKYKATAYPDSLKFTLLQTRDSLYVVTTSKKIGKKEYKSVNIINSNPNTLIDGITSIDFTVPKEYGRLSIGVHGGVDIVNRQPVISIGLNYDIIRFKKKIK